jgi:hypothetical protein
MEQQSDHLCALTLCHHRAHDEKTDNAESHRSLKRRSVNLGEFNAVELTAQKAIALCHGKVEPRMAPLIGLPVRQPNEPMKNASPKRTLGFWLALGFEIKNE